MTMTRIHPDDGKTEKIPFPKPSEPEYIRLLHPDTVCTACGFRISHEENFNKMTRHFLEKHIEVSFERPRGA